MLLQSSLVEHNRNSLMLYSGPLRIPHPAMEEDREQYRLLEHQQHRIQSCLHRTPSQARIPRHAHQRRSVLQSQCIASMVGHLLLVLTPLTPSVLTHLILESPLLASCQPREGCTYVQRTARQP